MKHCRREFVPRSGFTIIECLAAVALLGVFALITAPLVSQVQGVQSDLAQRELALLELRNAAELAMYDPNRAIELPTNVLSQFESPEFAVNVVAVEEEPAGEQLTLSLRWKSRTGVFVKPVQLTFWRWAAMPSVSLAPANQRTGRGDGWGQGLTRELIGFDPSPPAPLPAAGPRSMESRFAGRGEQVALRVGRFVSHSSATSAVNFSR
ncbi:type II secretion system protein [Planctomicrobium piriforme]|uniref:Prepilin-type N-terminal cleavage/methylation domain-containing protein n=1 Tax=Planctomicrobium piriforme TaxID=1576369 RepID=A0A1I3FET6_9PLAN|nr:type II secretion system protein [Planctomicrobium piriforme]SFI09714.1 prepilin-type N-terminal cleavage/methylation domain-containing protein [Planctomicrobium piriforme]